MDAAQFRSAFPEFSDLARYPTSQINFYLSQAALRVTYSIFGDAQTHASYLFVAHNIAAMSGSASGPVASKSVGSVSVSYDTNATNEEGAGWYNTTFYGKQFYRMLMIYGVGGVQL